MAVCSPARALFFMKRRDMKAADMAVADLGRQARKCVSNKRLLANVVHMARSVARRSDGRSAGKGQKKRRPPGATGGREREDVPMVRGSVQRRRFSGGGIRRPSMGAEDITEVCWFCLYSYRPSADWLGWRYISLGPALLFSAPAYPGRSLGLAVSANCRVQILGIRQQTFLSVPKRCRLQPRFL